VSFARPISSLYIGHVIGKGGICADPEKPSAVALGEISWEVQ